METDSGFVPPYGVTWSTFVNTLDKMKQEDVPNRIDRSYLGSTAGTLQTYLIAAFRSFGLIEEGGEVKKELVELAKSEDRPADVAALLEEHYPTVVALGKTKATPAELDELFTQEWDQRGETRVKAVRFYLGAATYAGVQTSPLWKAPRAAPATGRRRNRGGRGSTNSDAGGITTSTPPAAGSTTKTIMLKSGGSIALTVSVDLFSMSDADRTFALDLIDKLRKYEEPKRELEAPQGAVAVNDEERDGDEE